MDSLIEKLKELGFNSYEAKVYLALLKKYPATGYEVAQLADIPQSRAYDALKSLVNENVVLSSSEKPQKYTPIAPKELTSRFKRRINSTINFLEKKLPNVKENYNEPVHSIDGYEQSIDKIKEIIQNTNHSLYLELWSTDYKQIEEVIMGAYDRGVSIKIVSYDNLKTVFGLVYRHDNTINTEYNPNNRLVYVLSDNSECIFGRIQSNVVWTKNVEIALMMKEFLVREMYLLDIYDKFPEQLRYFYGAGFKKLKEKVLDRKRIV